MKSPIVGYESKAKQKQTGLAAVEFVVSAPIMIFMFMFVVELASALIQYNTMAKMVQNGVRHATVELLGTASSQPCNQEGMVNATKDIVVYGKVVVPTDPDAEPDPSPTPSPILDSITKDKVSVTCLDSYITVTITHEYIPQIIESHSGFDFAVPLVASAMMRY